MIFFLPFALFCPILFCFFVVVVETRFICVTQISFKLLVLAIENHCNLQSCEPLVYSRLVLPSDTQGQSV